MEDRFLFYFSVQKRYSERTATLYRSALDSFCAFALPEAEGAVDDSIWREILTPNLIRGYIAHGLEEGKSPRTMNLQLSALSSFCTWLVKSGFLASNPVRKVYRPTGRCRSSTPRPAWMAISRLAVSEQRRMPQLRRTARSLSANFASG